MEKSRTQTIACDVLIVGAGMAGLFVAWRALNNDPNLQVVIVDKLGRTGGRLETTTVPIKGKDGQVYEVRDEEGGMRFVPKGTGMENLWKLIDDLGLNTVPFPMADKNNRYYFRGESFTLGESEANSNAKWSTLYNLSEKEQNIKPIEILAKVMQDILDKNPGGHEALKWPHSPETWIEFRNTFSYPDANGNPVPMNQWGLWSLLHAYGLTQESIELLDHVIGFMGPFGQFINAGESLQIIFDFPAAAHFFALENGYESLPDALTSTILNKENYPSAQIILKEEISRIENQGDGTTAYGNKNTYSAGKVILAVPQTGLEQITRASPLLSDNVGFVRAMNSVQNMELSKVGLYFDERWWHSHPDINISSGPSFTDLPLGSVYCFAQYPAHPERDKTYNGPAALTLYTDFIRGNFWKEMQNNGPMYHTQQFPKNPEGTFAATVNLVEEVMKQIKMVYGLDPDDSSIPMPVVSTYRVWGQGEFGYGYHQFKLNEVDAEVYAQITWPAKNIFVCNEAWSPEQGWVEGSLIMGDLVSRLAFDLSSFTPDSGLSGIPLETIKAPKNTKAANMGS